MSRSIPPEVPRKERALGPAVLAVIIVALLAGGCEDEDGPPADAAPADGAAGLVDGTPYVADGPEDGQADLAQGPAPDAEAGGAPADAAPIADAPRRTKWRGAYCKEESIQPS